MEKHDDFFPQIHPEKPSHLPKLQECSRSQQLAWEQGKADPLRKECHYIQKWKTQLGVMIVVCQTDFINFSYYQYLSYWSNGTELNKTSHDSKTSKHHPKNAVCISLHSKCRQGILLGAGSQLFPITIMGLDLAWPASQSINKHSCIQVLAKSLK